MMDTQKIETEVNGLAGQLLERAAEVARECINVALRKALSATAPKPSIAKATKKPAPTRAARAPKGQAFERIAALLSDGVKRGTKEIADELKMPRASVDAAIKSALKTGALRDEGERKGRKFWLATSNGAAAYA